MTQRNGQSGTPQSQIERVERSRLSDSVAAQLTQLITQNVYQVGEKLPPERVLSEQFGVSRSSMREAIRSIESSGLVSSAHGVGVFVISNTMETPTQRDFLIFEDFTVAELFEIRRTLEGEAAFLAGERRTPPDEADLDQILAACLQPGLTNEGFVELDVRLHQAVARAAANRLLLRLYVSLEPLLLEYSRRIISLPGRRETAHNGHTLIVEAVKSGDGLQAREAALAHIRDVEADITKFLSEPE